jgi:hypothetical protein
MVKPENNLSNGIKLVAQAVIFNLSASDNSVDDMIQELNQISWQQCRAF